MTQKIHFPFVLLLAALLFMAAGPAVFGDSGGGPADAAGMGDSEAPSFAETERALQKLNWKITVAAYSFRKFTFWETVDQVSEMGIDSLYGFNFQTVGGGIEGKLDPAALSDEALWKIRTKLDSAGLELTALYYGAYPSDEAACRRIFERSRMLGVRYFVSEPRPEHGTSWRGVRDHGGDARSRQKKLTEYLASVSRHEGMRKILTRHWCVQRHGALDPFRFGAGGWCCGAERSNGRIGPSRSE